jgi:predicted RecB family nuclease
MGDEGGVLCYRSHWAIDRTQERLGFEWFIDLVFERMIRFPDLHIYHFGTYEPGAVKRLMLRYATREEEVDRLLRGGIFIDLHSVTKQSVRASVEQHSLKGWRSFVITGARYRFRKQIRRGISWSINWSWCRRRR